MRRNVLAILLVGCWMMLAGTDLLEDLSHLHDQPAVGGSSSADRGNGKRGSRPLANNIIESAHRPSACCPALLFFAAATAGPPAAFDFRAYFLRHKFYRVFLI